MKLIIDIPEEYYRTLQEAMKNYMPSLIGKIILNGTPIPDNATNGDCVKKMFCKGIVRISLRKNISVEFNKEWWNAPYQKGGKE